MIAAPELGLPGIRHGFFTREGGHSTGLYASLNCGFGSGDDKGLVRRNRAVAAEQLGVAPDRLLTAWQWHSADAVTATAPWDQHDPPKGDAIVTATPGLALGVLTADCVPVLFADAQARVIGAAHAGWKGAASGITDATIAAMEALGACRENIVAVLGPAISRAAYEVGPEFADRFPARHLASADRTGHYRLDLPGYLAGRLRAVGLARVADLALCTYADAPRFYSYRRATHRGESTYGRQLSAIALHLP